MQELIDKANEIRAELPQQDGITITPDCRLVMQMGRKDISIDMSGAYSGLALTEAIHRAFEFGFVEGKKAQRLSTRIILRLDEGCKCDDN